jgi:hypothetical protein
LPPAARARRDDAVLDVLETTAMHVRVSTRARAAALDSLARLLDARRRVGSAVLLTLDDLGGADDSVRVASVVRRLGRATYVVSAAPAGLSLAAWAQAVQRRAAAVRGETGAERRADGQGVPARVAVAVDATADERHAWAASDAANVDDIVLELHPSSVGAPALAAQWSRWTQWMDDTESRRGYWLLGTGGVPAAHGAMSQRYAMRGALAWATAEPRVRGAIVAETADHGTLGGLRTAVGAWRPAAGTVVRTLRVLRDTRAPVAAPAPVPLAADSIGG